MSRPDLWDDPQESRRIVEEVKGLKGILERHAALERKTEDVAVLLDLAREEGELSLQDELERELKAAEKNLKEFQLEILLQGEHDSSDAILSLHPGAGGTESQDWAQMLLRMYTRWAEKRGYGAEILDFLEGEEAGLKSVTVAVKGPNAYGFLKPERGVHRLVRISPFDASGRRHTSFASVEVMPDLPENGAIDIRPEEIKVDTYRASGAGGQHVNKTESAVRITHLPTGIVVQCQNERSQHANRDTAMKILRAKLVKHQEEERERELANIRGEQREIAWGNQIRSYVFHPYSLVKDHRTGVEAGNVAGVMDGDLDPFIYTYLEQKAGQARKE